MEHWEYLKPDGFRFVWDDALFPPGLDTFLIASAPELKAHTRICDLGSGAGLLSMILFQRQPDIYITGLEILPEAVKLANQCAEENQLTDRFHTIQADIRDINSRDLWGGSPFCPPFDLAVSNPPYYPASGRALSKDEKKRVARAEYAGNLSDFIRAAAKILRVGGKFCLVHKPERLTDLLCRLREHDLEPKRLRCVCRDSYAAPSLILLEARRGGKPGILIDRPLILYQPDGSPTSEFNQIYFREDIKKPYNRG